MINDPLNQTAPAVTPATQAPQPVKATTEINPDLLAAINDYYEIPVPVEAKERALRRMSSRMTGAGVPFERNFAQHHILRGKTESFLKESELVRTQGKGWFGSDIGMAAKGAGAHVMELGVKAAAVTVAAIDRIQVDMYRTFEDLDNLFGINADRTSQINAARRQAAANQEFFAGSEEYWEGVTARTHQEQSNEVAWYRDATRWTADTVFGLATWMAAGTGGPAGITAMILAEGNAKGKDVYDESGSISLGITSGVIHSAATMLVFRSLGGTMKNALARADKAFKGFDERKLFETGTLLITGRKKEFVRTIGETLKMFPTTVAIRETELIVSNVANQIILPELQVGQFEMTMDNFYSVAGGAIQEAAIFSALPLGMRTLGHTKHRKAYESLREQAKHIEARSSAEQVMKNFSMKAEHMGLTELQAFIDQLKAAQKNGKSAILDIAVDVFQAKIDIVQGKKVPLDPGKKGRDAFSEMSAAEQTREFKEFERLVEDIADGETGGNKVPNVENIDYTEGTPVADTHAANLGVKSRQERSDGFIEESVAEVAKESETPTAAKLPEETTKKLREVADYEAEVATTMNELMGEFRGNIPQAIESLKKGIAELELAEGTEATQHKRVAEAALRIFQTQQDAFPTGTVTGARKKVVLREIKLKDGTILTAEEAMTLLRKKEPNREQRAQLKEVVDFLEKEFADTSGKKETHKETKDKETGTYTYREYEIKKDVEGVETESAKPEGKSGYEVIRTKTARKTGGRKVESDQDTVNTYVVFKNKSGHEIEVSLRTENTTFPPSSSGGTVRFVRKLTVDFDATGAKDRTGMDTKSGDASRVIDKVLDITLEQAAKENATHVQFGAMTASRMRVFVKKLRRRYPNVMFEIAPAKKMDGGDVVVVIVKSLNTKKGAAKWQVSKKGVAAGGKRFKTKKAAKEAVDEILRKENRPSLEQLANNLKAETELELPSFREIAARRKKNKEEITDEEAVAAQKKNDESARASEAARVKAKDGQLFAKQVRELLSAVRQGKRDKKIADNQTTGTWIRIINQLDRGLRKELKIDEMVKEKNKRGRPVFKDVDHLIKTLDAVEAKIGEYNKKLVDTRLKKALRSRRESQQTHMNPVYDNVFTWVIKKLMPERAEKINIKEKVTFEDAIAEYRKTLNELGLEHQIPVLDMALEYLEMAEKNGIESLTFIEATALASYVEGLRRINDTVWQVEQMRKRDIEASELAKMREAMEIEWGADKKKLKRDSAGRVLEIDPTRSALSSLFASATYGKEANTSLSGTIEYLTGGNKSLMYKVMVEDVWAGISEMQGMERDLHKEWERVHEAHGITDAEISFISDKNPANKNFVHEIILADGSVLKLTRGNAVGLLQNLQDASTKELITGEQKAVDQAKSDAKAKERAENKGEEWVKPDTKPNAAVYQKGSAYESSQNLSLIDVELILKTFEGTIESKMATANVDFLNSEMVTKAWREYGLSKWNIDIILSDRHVSRERRAPKEVEAERGTEVEKNTTDAIPAKSLFEELQKASGLIDIVGNNPLVSDRIMRERRGGREHDIVISDGMFMVNRFVHSLSLLTKLEGRLERARRIANDQGGRKVVRDPETKEKVEVSASSLKTTFQESTANYMWSKIEQDFYSEIIRHETAHNRNHSRHERNFRIFRNNVQVSGLALHPAIIAYQPLSINAAAFHWGTKGGRTMLTALKEWATTSKAQKQAFYDKVLENSPLFWQREIQKTPSALASAETNQYRQKTYIVAGKKYSKKGRVDTKSGEGGTMAGIQMADTFAILRVYRMAELYVDAQFQKKGLDKVANPELYKKVVVKEFERAVIETQPTFHPAYQTSFINRGKRQMSYAAFSMFRGYVSKLQEIQIKSMWRANRAWRNGNKKEAGVHLAKMAGQTIISTMLIPVIRNAVKFSVIKSPLIALGLLDLGEEVKEEKDNILWDVFAQSIGIPFAGEFVAEAIMTYGRDEQRLEPTISPLIDIASAAVREINSLMHSADQDYKWNKITKMSLSSLRLAASVTGLPNFPINALRRMITEWEEQERLELMRRRGGIDLVN